MRIAFFTHYTELYGANRSLLDLIDGLAAYRVRPHVFCPAQGALVGELRRRRIAVAVAPFEWWVSTKHTKRGAAERRENNRRLLDPIAEQLTRWRIDLVHTNSSVIPIGRDAATHLGLPHVWHVREFGTLDYDLIPDDGVRSFRREILAANRVIFVSHALKRQFVGATQKLRPNVRVIYNGVARAAVFEARRRRAESLHGRRQPFTFVLVGRFRESKGQHVAIAAFTLLAKRSPEVRLILVGDAGPTGDQSYLDACRSMAAASPAADRIEFWGFVPDPESAYLQADAALMCSRNEAMGRVTVEAMSACRPVIGFDSGGTSELIEHNRTGLLYRGGEMELAAMMAEYVVAPELARHHGAEAWKTARERHSIETYAAQVLELIRGIA